MHNYFIYINCSQFLLPGPWFDAYRLLCNLQKNIWHNLKGKVMKIYFHFVFIFLLWLVWSIPGSSHSMNFFIACSWLPTQCWTDSKAAELSTYLFAPHKYIFVECSWNVLRFLLLSKVITCSNASRKTIKLPVPYPSSHAICFSIGCTTVYRHQTKEW